MALRVAEDQRTPSTLDDVVQRRALAIVQHQQVMDEAAAVARMAAQARNRAAAAPIFADTRTHSASIRARVNWEQAS